MVTLVIPSQRTLTTFQLWYDASGRRGVDQTVVRVPSYGEGGFGQIVIYNFFSDWKSL